jgi:hypothetical protein
VKLWVISKNATNKLVLVWEISFENVLIQNLAGSMVATSQSYTVRGTLLASNLKTRDVPIGKCEDQHLQRVRTIWVDLKVLK